MSPNDFFTSLGLPRKRIELSGRQVRLELHPTTSGALSRLAKPPVLEAQDVRVTVEPLESDVAGPTGVRVEATIAVSGLVVTSPDFKASDKGEIQEKVRHKLLGGDHHPTMRFASQDVATADGGAVVARGRLAIRGREAPCSLRFEKEGSGRYRARTEVVQTAFGLKPLSALLGGLKSDDRVAVEIAVDLGGATPA